ncbi:MAG: hypothetical protein E7585_01125 [Ruminococcaceae bacterium]|nr:hypothetical protein [Oscillospiraceae bacterium]
MKKTFCIDCKEYTYNADEYERLYEELLKRMEWLFSHGYTLVSMVAVFWSITLSVLGAFLSSELASNSPFTFLIPFLTVLLVGAPAIFVYPFSVKYQDNVRTVASLGAYFRVFYELPSILKKTGYAKNKNGDMEHKVFAWETLHCDTHYERTGGFGAEYIIISSAALVLSLTTGIVSIIAYSQCRIWFMLLFLFFWGGLGVVSYKVWKNSCTRTTIDYYFVRYLHTYLAKAVNLELLTSQECKIYLKYTNTEIMQEKAMDGVTKEYNFRILHMISVIETLLQNEDYTEIKKMLCGLRFDKNDKAYCKLLTISKQYCAEYSKLCAIPNERLTDKERERKEELLDVLFPGHGTLYGIGAGIEVVIGMVELGDNCYINANVKFNPDVKVKTGDYFICAPNVTFGSDESFDKVGQIEIGDDVWVCADVTVQKGVKIGSRSVIGLSSVVKTESALGDDSIYSGAPAVVASAIENRGVAACKSECTEPSDDYEKAFVAHLRSLGFEGDFSQLLYLLRGEKYNAQDPLAAAVTDYTHALYAEYATADKKRRAELKNILFPFKGENCTIGENVFVECIGSVRLGGSVTVGNCVTLMGSIVLGDRCTIEEKVSLVGIGHEVYHENRHVCDGCMINTSRVIRVESGVHIGKGKKLAPKTPIEKDQI